MHPTIMNSTVRRGLGIYFIVSGALLVPAVLYGLAVETVGIQQWAVAAVPGIQAIVAAVAGWYLVRTSTAGPDVTAAAPVHSNLPLALQLLGVYLAVEGITDTIRPVVDMIVVTSAWEYRAASLAAGLIHAGLGLVLIAKPDEVVKLANMRSSGHSSTVDPPQAPSDAE